MNGHGDLFVAGNNSGGSGQSIRVIYGIGAVRACGDGQLGVGEACDDGGTASGDGCSDTCEVEPGFNCTGEPSVCTNPLLVCANGLDDDGDGFVDYPDDPGCRSLVDPTESPNLQCNVEMGQPSYVDGEEVVISSLRFANLESSSVRTRLRLQLTLPIGTGFTVDALDIGAIGLFRIPGSFDHELGPVTMFTLSPSTPLRGHFEWRCALEDPTTGEVVAEDRTPFDLQ